MTQSDMMSHTRVLFTEAGQPVPGLAVRSEAGDEIETDENGQVELSFETGQQQLEVFRDGIWVPQVIDGSTDSSLIIVDLARRDTREMKAVRPETSFLDIGKLNLGDRYSYHEVLGRGGMSVVIRARDRLLHRDVAIKVLSQELASDPEAQNLFLTEARNLATLSHPNLVAVHDICKVDEQVFIVIEYVEGESLEKLVRGVGGLSETAALRTLVQLARVVSYMHEHGVIHRDLKPSNALIRQDGTLKLIDFGLARRFDDLYIRGTRVRGTPAYMSPEQFKGEPLTAACDIYMLGVCMFQVLTGELPFPKGDMGFAHVYEDAPRVESVNSEVSTELCDVVAACLEKKPGDRPGDGKELLRLLQNIYQGAGSKPTTLAEMSHEEEHASMQDFTPNDPDTLEFVGDIADVERFGLQTTADTASVDESTDAIQAVMEAADATGESGRPHDDDPDESAAIEFEVDDLELDDEELGEDEPDEELDADKEAPLPPAAPVVTPASVNYAAEAAAMERALRVATEEQAKTSAEVARLSALLSDPDVQRRLKSEPRSMTMLPIMVVAVVSALVVAVIFQIDDGTDTAPADATEATSQFSATPPATADPLPEETADPGEQRAVDPAVMAAIEASENASSSAAARAVESHEAVSEGADTVAVETSPAETTMKTARPAGEEAAALPPADAVAAPTNPSADPPPAEEAVVTTEERKPAPADASEKPEADRESSTGAVAGRPPPRKVEKSSTGFLKPISPSTGGADQGAR